MDAFFRFPTAVKHEPEIDEWIDFQSDALRPLAKKWVEFIRARGKDVRELMHDGAATACVGDAAFAYVAIFKSHVNVGLFFGALLPDPHTVLEGTGKRGRHVKVRPGEAVNERALEALIKAAYAHAKKQ